MQTIKNMLLYTIKFSKTVHGHTRCPCDKLEESDPLFSIHQQDNLKEQSDTHTKLINILVKCNTLIISL